MSKTTIPTGGITDGTLTSAKLDQDGAFTFNEDSADVDFRVESNGNANMLFVSGGNDVVGIGAEGDLGVGLHIKSADSGSSVASGADELIVEGSGDTGLSILSGTDANGSIMFGDSADNDGGRIQYNPNNDRMLFTVAGNEAMRVDSAGHLLVNATAQTVGASLAVKNDTTETTLELVNVSTSGNHRIVDFRNGDGDIGGSININTGSDSVSFETSSDYRLKENVADLTGAITRIKNLKPIRFNFKKDTDTTLDGFLAHEVQSVVPQAVSGDKDGTETRKNIVVNSKGNVIADNKTETEWTAGKSNGEFANDTEWFASKEFMVKQGIDHSKLVPLLTAALQEAVTKIEALEARVTTLEE